MTTSTEQKETWEEEMQMAIGDDINNLLEYRGVYDCGKSMRGGVEREIIPRIKRLLSSILAEKRDLVNKIPSVDHEYDEKLEKFCQLIRREDVLSIMSK